MENISTIRSDTSERAITFKFTNTTDTDKDIYIKDITLYSFLRNIDWVNNVFSWVELRDIPLDKLVCNPPNNTVNGGTGDDAVTANNDEQTVTGDIVNGDDTQPPVEQPPADTIQPMKIPILCCLRIPPGSYKNTESIIAMINTKLQEISNTGIAITGIQAIHNIPACAYDIGDIAIQKTDNNVPWYPAIIDSPVVLNNFDISLDNTNNNTSTNITCIPVLEYDANNKELSLPLEGSLNYNNLSIYNSDLISKMGSSSLTSHAISFINGITNTLAIDKIDINISDLYTSEYGLIRYRENASNYTEFIINPSNTGLINEITSKYNAMNTVTKYTSGYSEIAADGDHKILGCVAYPFFPASTKLYLYNCNAPYIDKVIESQLSTERLFGISLANVEVSSEWTNQSQNAPEHYIPPYGVVETLDTVTSVRPITVSVNSIITIPHGATTSIYVIGDNQWYPLWRSSHTLTYKVIN